MRVLTLNRPDVLNAADVALQCRFLECCHAAVTSRDTFLSDPHVQPGLPSPRIGEHTAAILEGVGKGEA